MDIKFHCKHLTLTDHQRDYVSRKVEHLKRLAHRGIDESAMVSVEVEHVEHKDPTETIGMKINMVLPNHRFHAEGFGSSVEEAVDVLEEKLKAQIEHTKRDGGIHRS